MHTIMVIERCPGKYQIISNFWIVTGLNTLDISAIGTLKQFLHKSNVHVTLPLHFLFRKNLKFPSFKVDEPGHQLPSCSNKLQVWYDYWPQVGICWLKRFPCSDQFLFVAIYRALE